MSDYGGGAGSSLDYYEAEARKHERIKAKRHAARVTPRENPRQSDGSGEGDGSQHSESTEE